MPLIGSSGARCCSRNRALRGSWFETRPSGTPSPAQRVAASTTTGSTTKSASNQHRRAGSTPMSQPSSSSASARADSTGRRPVTTSAQEVAKSVSSSRLASTPKRSLKAACQGPRPPRPGSRTTPSTSRAKNTRAGGPAGVLSPHDASTTAYGPVSSERSRASVSTVRWRVTTRRAAERGICREANTPGAAAPRSAGKDRRVAGVRSHRRRPDRTSGRPPSTA